jgi:hypothetical protein
MAISDQDRLFENLTRSIDQSGVLSFLSWLEESAQDVLRKDATASAAYASANASRLWTHFQKMNNELLVRHRIAAFDIVDLRNRMFVVNGTSNPADRSTWLRSHRAAILRWIDAGTDRKFEYVGAMVAHLCGARRTLVTPRGNEGGVDFYALVPVWGTKGVMYSPERYLKIVGQSKRYSSRMAVDKAREHTQVVASIRHRSTGMDARLPVWFKQTQGPVVGAIVAWRGFQSGATSECHDHGIVTIDAIDLAETILNSRQYNRERGMGKTTAQILDAAIAEVGWL